jgi:ABC-2 type transport system permease protein
MTKFFVAFVFAAAATFAVTASGLLSGTIFFGWRPMSGPLFFSMPEGEALYNLVLSSVYVIVTMLPVLTFGVMLSTMTDIPAGAIGGAFGLSVVSQILDAISGLGPVRNVLPTHYSTAWVNLFFSVGADSDLPLGLVSAVTYGLVFSGIAFWWFARKDVLS